MGAVTARTPDQEKRRVALGSAIAAVGLTAFKAIVGVATGSLGILAEAAHSGLDLVAALVTYFAVRFAGRPPDLDHTYGHGKVENLSALVETLLLLLTCVWIVAQAVDRLMEGGVEIDPSPWAFLIMITAVGVDYTRSRALFRAAKKYRSQALEADALHFSTDIWSSSVVILGLASVWIGQRYSMPFLETADPVAALGVSAIVIWVSVALGRRTIDVLLDRVPPHLSGDVVAAAGSAPGVVRATRARVREVGGRHFVDVEVEIDRSTAFELAEDITTNVVKKIQVVLPSADVVVHTKPVAARMESAVQKVQLCAARLALKIHHVVVFESGGRKNVNYHLEVSDDALLGDAWETARRLEEEVRKELSGADVVNVHFDPRSATVGTFDIDNLDVQNLARRAREVLLAHSEIKGVHDLIVHRVGGAGEGTAVTDLSCHCLLAPETPVRRIHELDDALQAELRDLIPSLRHLFITPEPGSGP